MTRGLDLLRLLIREEMEYYGKIKKTYGSGSSGVVEIEKRMEELQSIEGQIMQLEVTPAGMTEPGDTSRLDNLRQRKSELEQEIKELQDIL